MNEAVAVFESSRATDIEIFLFRGRYAGPNEAACVGYAAQNTPEGVVRTSAGFSVSWGSEAGRFTLRVMKVDTPPAPPEAKPRSRKVTK